MITIFILTNFLIFVKINLLKIQKNISIIAYIKNNNRFNNYLLNFYIYIFFNLETIMLFFTVKYFFLIKSFNKLLTKNDMEKILTEIHINNVNLYFLYKIDFFLKPLFD